MPDYPPPKPAARPTPAPRAAPGPIPRVQVEIANGVSKHDPSANAAGEPVYEVELVSGPLSKTISASPTTNYLKLLDMVKKSLEYEDGTFSLW